MASEQKHTAANGVVESRTWSVSLLGCLQSNPTTLQVPWPWLMCRACACPASVLGANETLFQGEEPADVCCLQPYSCCGPTCRDLNAQLCGLGNEGLKLCTYTCIMQAACSCFCLGLPYVAWLAGLQRQRVMAKHGVAVTDEDAWATACYPCSLLQIHALLQQQHRQHSPPSPRHYQHQQAASLPLRAPRLQQMTGCASENGLQASSQAGPLTSAMTTSKVLRTVRDRSARSEGAAPAAAAAGGSVQQGDVRGSCDCDCSSEASETGVVNSPLTDPHQQRQQSGPGRGPDGSSKTPSSRRGSNSARERDRRTSTASTCCSEDGAAAGSRLGAKQSPAASAPVGGPFLRPPPAAQQQPLGPQHQQQQLVVGPLMSARSNSSAGGPLSSSQQQLLPPRPGLPRARHARTSSLGSEAAAAAAAVGAAVRTQGCASDCHMPPDPAGQEDSQAYEPVSSSGGAACSNKRKLPGRAMMTSQSCHLPGGLANNNSSSSSRPEASCNSSHSRDSSGLRTPPRAAAAAAAAAAGALDSSPRTPHMYSSCGQGGLAGSCSKLVSFSQEDVPLSAFKANPGGKGSRRGSLGASIGAGAGGTGTAAAAAGAGGWGGCSNTAGSLASSMQQQQGVGAVVAGTAQHAARACQDAAGLQQPDPQYATMQSDICNFASWLGEEAADANTGLSLQQQQQQQLVLGSAGVCQVAQECSDADLCNFEGPNSTVISPVACSPRQERSLTELPAATADTAGSSPGAVNSSSGGSSAAAADGTAQSISPGAVSGSDGAAAAKMTAAEAAAVACSARPTVLAAAWAYMSDMCNLGRSFDAASSTVGRAGLAAAALSRFADSAQQGQGPTGAAAAPAGAQDSARSGNAAGSSSSSSKPQQGPGASAAAAGSWPDTAPSPPFATLANGTTDGGAASKLACTSSGTAAAVPEAAEEPELRCNSPPRRRRAAAGGAQPSNGGSSSSSRGSPAGAASSDADSNSSSRKVAQEAHAQTACDRDGDGPAAAAAGATGAVGRAGAGGIDPQLLAAVTGTTSRDQLTASQEELAAKLARLAFANPAAARQLTAARQQHQGQQQQQAPQPQPHQQPPPRRQQHQQPVQQSPMRGGSSAGGGHSQQSQQRFEPFYPTMMSDMCNLGDPEGSSEQLPASPSQGGLHTSEQQLSSATGAAAGGSAVLSTQLHQQQGRAAAAGSNSGPASKAFWPGWPQQQRQQQQAATAAGRLGRPPVPGALRQPGSNAMAAMAAPGAAAVDGDNTAGPLRAALLLRGLRAAPGGSLGGGSGSPSRLGAAGSGPPAAGGRQAARPGAEAAAAAAAGSVGAGMGLAGAVGYPGGQPLQYRCYAEESLTSFDSYYVDCDLRHPASEAAATAATPAPAAAAAGGGVDAAEAANMLTTNPLYTLSASEGGGVADSLRISQGYKQHLQQAAAAGPGSATGPAAGSGKGGGNRGNGGSSSARGSLQQQQQQRKGPGAAGRGLKTLPRSTAGAGAAVAVGAVGKLSSTQRSGSSSSHEQDDEALQLDNSRSSSPAQTGPGAAGSAVVHEGVFAKAAAARGVGDSRGRPAGIPAAWHGGLHTLQAGQQ